MKTILVPVEHHEDARASVELAATLATQFGSIIEGFALRTPPLVGVEWDPASVAMMDSLRWSDAEIREQGRALFAAVMAARGIAPLTEGGGRPGGGGPAWRWLDEPLAGNEFVESYGRVCDVTVVGRPSPDGSAISTLEAALFDSGGPVLIAPPAPLASFGERVVLAWNGSGETARTIAFAWPLLLRARQVTVLADDGGLAHGPAGELVQRRLARHGVEAGLRRLGEGRIRSGEAVLAAAAELGCDLLLKGAYTQSRLRQMIFGGATRHILEQAEVPVFMAH